MGSYGNTEVADKTATIVAYPAVVTNRGASAWGHRSVHLNGEVLSTGGDIPSDAGFDYWIVGDSVTSTVTIGGQDVGVYSSFVSALVPGNDYQFVAYAVNAGGRAVSDVRGFSTRSVTGGGLYVSTNGDNTAGTNWSTSLTDLQDAINIAEPGDSILIAGHSFVVDPAGAATVIWTLQNKNNITVIGGYQATSDAVLPGPNDPAQWPTKLSRNSANLARILLLDGLTSCTIQGIQVLNGLINIGGNQDQSASGIFIRNSTNLTLDHCLISNNVSKARITYGGGLYVTNSWLTLTNCLIASCQVDGFNFAGDIMPGYGGGVCLYSGSMTIIDSVIRNCLTRVPLGGAMKGGGIYVHTGASLVMRRSVLVSNQAENSVTNESTSYGSGLCFLGNDAYLENCLVVKNGGNNSHVTRYGDGIYYGGSGTLTLTNCTVADNIPASGIQQSSGTAILRNSILWGNSSDDLIGNMSVAYCDIQTPDTFWTNGVNGCLSVDPLFANSTYYHLQSQGGYYAGGYFSGGSWSTSLNDSPCIDAGNPASDFSLEPMPNGSQVNLGAYGNTPVASKTIAKGTIFKSF